MKRSRLRIDRTTGVPISVKYMYTERERYRGYSLGLELVRGACPGPLEMGALTVNGSRRKAAYGWPMGYGITVSGYRTRLTVPDI